MKSQLQAIKLLCVLIFSFVSFATLPVQVLSQSSSDPSDFGGDGGGADTNQTTNGSRGCGSELDSTESATRALETITLTALVPPKKIYGGTTRENPTFWFHIHYHHDSFR